MQPSLTDSLRDKTRKSKMSPPPSTSPNCLPVDQPSTSSNMGPRDIPESNEERDIPESNEDQSTGPPYTSPLLPASSLSTPDLFDQFPTSRAPLKRIRKRIQSPESDMAVEPSIPPSRDHPEMNEDPPIVQPEPPSDFTRAIINDYTSFPECTFPPEAKEVVWPGGQFKTKLPWISDPKDDTINLLQNVRPIYTSIYYI
jgi:hypothetical protein